jgi:hypothetical protein
VVTHAVVTVNKSAISLHPQLPALPLPRSETLNGDLESPMNCHREPTLDGILSDPIVRAVMEADCVNPLELEEMLRQVAQRLRTPNLPDGA